MLRTITPLPSLWRVAFGLALPCLAGDVLAQPAPAQPATPPAALAAPLTEAEAVALAVRQSPAVAAARSRLEAAAASVRGARAPFNPQAEVAPGVGFTNGNALLSQQFDISGL